MVSPWRRWRLESPWSAELPSSRAARWDVTMLRGLRRYGTEGRPSSYPAVVRTSYIPHHLETSTRAQWPPAVR